MTSLSILANGPFLGAVTLKSLTTAAVYSVINKYLNQPGWGGPAAHKSPIGPPTSSAIAGLLMTSIAQRLLALGGGNEGVKRIFDQGPNAAIPGGPNIKAYELLVKKAPNLGGKTWDNHGEFFAQMLADAVGGVLSYYYFAPLFGLDTTNITTVYG